MVLLSERNKFEAAISGLLPTYSSIVINVVANRSEIGEWDNLMTSILLHPDPVPLLIKNLPHPYPGPDSFRIIHEVRPISDLSAILNDLETGTLIVGGISVIYLRNKRQPKPEIYSLYYSSIDRKEGIQLFGVSIPGHILRGQGDNRRYFIEYSQHQILDNTLKCHPEPFDGIDGAINSNLTLPPSQRSSGTDTTAGYFIIAPVLGVFDISRCGLSSKRLHIRMIFHPSLAGKEFRIGVIMIPLRKQKFFGTSFIFKVPKKQKRGPWSTFVKDIPMKNRVLVNLFFSYNNILMDETKLQVTGPESLNPRHVVHGVIDRENTLLERFLFSETVKKGAPGTTDQNRFERGVNWLFTLIGYHVLYYGENSDVDESPDMVVISQSNDYIYPVECTVGPISNKEKIQKFSVRTDSIKRALNIKYSKSIIQPLLITWRPYADIPQTDLETAEGEGISVLCREHLRGMLDSTPFYYSEEDWHKHFKSQVPQTRIRQNQKQPFWGR